MAGPELTQAIEASIASMAETSKVVRAATARITLLDVRHDLMVATLKSVIRDIGDVIRALPAGGNRSQLEGTERNIRRTLAEVDR